MNRATGGTSWDSKPAGLGALGSAYTYDPNGNLKTVVRNDAAAQSVDNLTYTPVGSTVNLLDKVVDGTTAAASSYTNDLDETQANGNYAYDATGNLTKDVAAGISTGGIQWTPYGKIKQITNATYRIEYLYDAMGNRVRQKRTKLSDNTYVTTYYGRDASGKNVVGTYEKIGTGSTVLKEVPLYGSTRLGILRPNATQSTTAITPPAVYTRSLGRKEYEITDHLGNVRVSISDRLVKPGSDWLNDVKMQTDYFPYGMQREDRNDNVTGYRYGYNGKENDNDVKGEGNQQDYGFRIYDPRVARFLSVDPLTADYPWYTPYQFAGNTPIQAVDLDGLEEWYYMNGARAPFTGPLSPQARQRERVVSAEDVANATIMSASVQGLRASSALAVRLNYIEAAAKLRERTPANIALRDQLVVDTRSVTPVEYAKTAEVIKPRESLGRKTSNPAKTNSMVDGAMAATGRIGKGLMILGAVNSAVNIANADDKPVQVAYEAAGWGGAMAGAEIGAEVGATVGTVGGPKGMVVGGFGGALVGGFLGGMLGERFARELFPETESNSFVGQKENAWVPVRDATSVSPPFLQPK